MLAENIVKRADYVAPLGQASVLRGGESIPHRCAQRLADHDEPDRTDE